MTNNIGRLGTTRGLDFFTKLGNSINSLKAINWSGLINNTSKTLGIVNQTIPIVKQVGPMVNNMKSMLKLASIFKDETDIHPNNTHNTQKNKPTSSSTQQTTKEEDYSPTFFLSS